MSLRFSPTALLLTTALLLFAAAFTASATTYYVDPVSGQDTYSGTSAAVGGGNVGPWRTVAQVQSAALQPGDTVLFKASGIFTDGLTITRSGSASQPLTFGRYGSGSPPVFKRGLNQIVDGSGAPSDWASAIEVSGNASYVVIDGLQAQDSHYAGVRLNPGTHHVTLRSCSVTNVGVGVLIQGSNNNTITGNWVWSPHMVVNTPQNVRFDDDFGANGVVISGMSSGNVISRNAFIHCAASSYDYGTDGGALELYAENGVVIDNNRFLANRVDTGNGVVEIGGQGGTVSNLKVAFNVCYRNGLFGYFHTSGTFGVQYSGIEIDHNTVVEPDNYLGVPAVIVFGAPLPDWDLMTWRGNIFYVGGNFASVASNFNCVHFRNDFYRVNPSTTQYGIGVPGNLNPSGNENIDLNPLFVTLNAGSWVFDDQNLRLQAGSPCIGTGVDLRYEGYSTDYAGTALYVGSPDRGAYEQ